MEFLVVALGGATGSLFRYLISLIPLKFEFPILTFLTNFLGALLIGIIFGLSKNLNISKNLTLFWQTGVCGGFTTFSTFSLESYKLLVEGNYLIAMTYILSSIVCCLFGVFIGYLISTKLLTS